MAGGVSQPSLRGASDYVIFSRVDFGGNNYAQGGRKKVELAGEKQVTKKTGRVRLSRAEADF